MNVAFTWTSAAFRARAKTCTRREWTPDYARPFTKDSVHTAIDKQYRFGGKKIGTFLVVQDAYEESTLRMPITDYVAEGFAWMDDHPQYKPTKWKGIDLKKYFRAWRISDQTMWILRFQILTVEDPIEEVEHAKRLFP